MLIGLFASPVSAQTADLDRAVQALGANWRPVDAANLTAASIQTACAGAIEEIAAVEAAVPTVITPDSLARVRSLGGLIIVPADDMPGGAYFFPPAEMAWFASGFGAVAVVSEAEGFLGIRDAAGRDIALQLGRAGGRPVLRLRDPGGEIQSFVGCAPTAGRQ